MKVFLGISLLIGGFVLVLVLRERSIDAAVAEGAAEVRPGWATVRIGRHSGAAPTEARTAERAPRAALDTPPPPPPAPTEQPPREERPEHAAREFEMTVRRGQTLSEICRAHYKTARPSLVEALARHNGLAKPGALREGSKLRLPPIEALERR